MCSAPVTLGGDDDDELGLVRAELEQRSPPSHHSYPPPRRWRGCRLRHRHRVGLLNSPLGRERRSGDALSALSASPPVSPSSSWTNPRRRRPPPPGLPRLPSPRARLLRLQLRLLGVLTLLPFFAAAFSAAAFAASGSASDPPVSASSFPGIGNTAASAGGTVHPSDASALRRFLRRLRKTPRRGRRPSPRTRAVPRHGGELRARARAHDVGEQAGEGRDDGDVRERRGGGALHGEWARRAVVPVETGEGGFDVALASARVDSLEAAPGSQSAGHPGS